MSAYTTGTNMLRKGSRAFTLAIATVALAWFGAPGGPAAFANPPVRIGVVGGNGLQQRPLGVNELLVAGTTKVINGEPITVVPCGYFYSDVNSDEAVDALDVTPFIERLARRLTLWE